MIRPPRVSTPSSGREKGEVSGLSDGHDDGVGLEDRSPIPPRTGARSGRSRRTRARRRGTRTPVTVPSFPTSALRPEPVAELDALAAPPPRPRPWRPASRSPTPGSRPSPPARRSAPRCAPRPGPARRTGCAPGSPGRRSCRGAGDVERHVAAADHDDARAHLHLVAEVDVEQIVDAAQHAIQLHARGSGRSAAAHGADPEEDAS